jgi:hypothetical protein
MEDSCPECPHVNGFVVAPDASPLWRSIYLGATLLAVILGGLLAGL